MKQIILLFFILGNYTSFGQVQNSKIMSASQLQFIQEKFHWHSDTVLIINFHHRSEHCFYDNNAHLYASERWWNKFYKKMKETNCSSIFVYSDKVSARKLIDNVTKFEDYDDFLLQNFFNTKNECSGVLVVNSKGAYEIWEGEYYLPLVESFVRKLKN